MWAKFERPDRVHPTRRLRTENQEQRTVIILSRR
jgi:hypothetical protein